MNWITEHKLPLGQWMEAFVDWLTFNATGFFDAISFSLEWLILTAVDIFQWFPPFVPMAITAAIAWFLHRSIPLVVFVVAALMLILNLGLLAGDAGDLCPGTDSNHAIGDSGHSYWYLGRS